MSPRSWKDYNLLVGGDVHPEPGLGGDAKALSRRRVTDLSLEARAFALELGSPDVEPRERFGLSNADRSPPHDRQRD
jgi:hypothetical protein